MKETGRKNQTGKKHKRELKNKTKEKRTTLTENGAVAAADDGPAALRGAVHGLQVDGAVGAHVGRRRGADAAAAAVEAADGRRPLAVARRRHRSAAYPAHASHACATHRNHSSSTDNNPGHRNPHWGRDPHKDRGHWGPYPHKTRRFVTNIGVVTNFGVVTPPPLGS